MTQASPWWHPHVHADRRGRLMARARVQAALRAHFAGEDFVEVDPTILQVSPGNEAHLHAFATTLIDMAGARRGLYLHTSPEFALKKLLAAGEEKLFAFAHVFRNRERTALHHPEFVMLEWYRAGAPLEVLMRDCAEALRLACAAAGTDRLVFRGNAVDPALAPERITLAQAFEVHAGIDLLATLSPDGVGERDALAAVARRAGIRIANDDSWSDIFSRVLSERIEPRLGMDGRATILHDYPLPEAALARRSPRDARLAERFELYACGVELANAFGELIDPVEQRRRLEAEMDEKARVHGERYPLDEDFLAALALMPEASGIALGFDRLVMLATGAERIDDVLWTPLPA